MSLEHGQRRWRRDEIRQTVPHSRRGHGKRTVADGGQPRWRNDESGCWRRAQAPPSTEVGDTPEVAGEVRWRSELQHSLQIPWPWLTKLVKYNEIMYGRYIIIVINTSKKTWAASVTLYLSIWLQSDAERASELERQHVTQNADLCHSVSRSCWQQFLHRQFASGLLRRMQQRRTEHGR